MPKIPDIKVPLKKNGDLIGYPESYYLNGQRYSPDFSPNRVFEADIEITSYSRGRSSAKFDAQDKKTGRRYEIFLVDMLEILQKCNIQHGLVKHRFWHFVKRGQNYGITPTLDPHLWPIIKNA